MTQEEILEAIKNTKWNQGEDSLFGKYEYTELLLFYDKNSAYSIDGVRYSDGITVLNFSKLLPEFKTYGPSGEYPYKEIENLKTMWYSELMEKYGCIQNAMKSIE